MNIFVAILLFGFAIYAAFTWYVLCGDVKTRPKEKIN